MSNKKLNKLLNIILLCVFILINNNLYSQNSYNNYIIKFKKNTINLNNSNKSNLDKSQNDNSKNTQFLNKYNLNYSNFYTKITNKIGVNPKSNNLLSLNLMNEEFTFDNFYICENNSQFKEFLKEFEENNHNELIEYITPNYIYKIDNSNLSNDSRANEQWALQKLNADKLWEYATGKGIVVGVIDTGIDWLHQDMKNQLWINKSEDLNNNGYFDNWSVNEVRDGITGDLDNIDNDNNGFVDDVIGYDFVDQYTFNFGDYQDYDPNPYDENGHGTNVSSIINAENNNNFGISGLAFNSKIITARAFDATGSGESDDVAAAIIYCALNGAKVLNFSFGERFKSPIIEDAIKFAASKGCIMVSSSGNNNWWFEHYPSDLKEVFSVGSSTIDDNKDSFSNYGSFVDVLAPGSRVLVATPGNEFKLSSGTSLSAPYVASLIAMMLEIDSTLNYNNIFSLIKTNCNDIGPEGWDFINSAGIINPLKTLQNLYKSNISFVDIPNEVYIDKTTISKLELKANIIEPLFQNYEVRISEGLYHLSDTKFTTIDSGNTQVFGGIITKIDLSKLKDTLYTISLVVNRSNRSQVQQRIKLYVNSTFKKLEITDKKIYEALKDNKKVIIAHIYTNEDSYIQLKYKNKNNSDISEYKTIQNYDKFTNNHILIIDDTLSNLKNIEFEVTVFNNNVDNYNGTNNIKTEKFDYSIQNNNPFKLDFISKNYSLPPSYLSKDIITNDKNEKYIITNEYINGAQFGKIYLNKFVNIDNKTNLIKVDSLVDLTVNLNIGKINNENYLLTTSEFKNAVYKIDINNQQFEQTPIYSSGIQKREWGGAFIDLDNDGNSELINYNDTNFVVYQLVNSSFVPVAATDNINKEVIGVNGKTIVPRKLSTKPAFEFGDFGNEKNVFIYEIENILYTYKVNLENNKINFTFLKNYNYFNSKGRTIKQIHLIDRNGDNNNDICVLTNGDVDFNTLRQVSDNTWTIEILEDNFQNELDIDFNPLFIERVYGYKDGFISNFGFSYKNNLSTIAFDKNSTSNKSQDLVLSLTPNLYIINNLTDEDLLNKKSIVNWYPFNFSNEIIYEDFDNNGVKELALNFFGGVEFLELEKNPIQISGFDGYPKNENSALLFWDKLNPNNNYNITDYDIYKITNVAKGELEFINSTKENSILITNLIENTNYEFLIRGIDSTDKSNVKIGQFSYPITVSIFPHKAIRPTRINVIDSTLISVEFSGKLPLNYIDLGKFEISNLELNNTINIFSVIRLNNNSLLIKLKNTLINDNYKLIVKSFDDYYRTPTIEDSLFFSYIYNKVDYLNLIRLEQTQNKLKLFFSDSIDFNNLKLNNFELAPYGRIIDLIFEHNEFGSETKISDNITLLLDEMIFQNTQGIIYNIKAKDIISINNLAMTTNEGSSLSFVLRQNSLNDVYTLPNPFKYSKNEILTFGNLSLNSKIEIYDLNGNLIKELIENDGDGGVNWDLKDNNNNLLIEGIYLYKISGQNDLGDFLESELKKFVVLP